MNPIGPLQPVAIPAAPAVGQGRAPASGAGATLPKPSTGSDPIVSTQVAEQKRMQAVQKMAEDIANVYIVGDKRFTIFKDMSGQYITRFTSLRDGSVTYIPEPQLFKMQQVSQNTQPAVLKISV